MAFFIDTTSYRSPNHSARPVGTTIDMIVLHTGEGSKASDLRELTRADVPMASRKSAHYYVDRAGNTYELVNPAREAWHAGESSWQGRNSLQIRNHSIGIESEHRAGQNWPTVQRQAFADLCRHLIERFPIEQRYVVAHRWIAPSRRGDPTDWPDAELKAWIASLFVQSDPFADWGDIDKPAGPARQFGIPQAWLKHKAVLGPCLRGERYDLADRVSRALFAGGELRYFAPTNVVEVLMYPKRLT